MGDQKTDGKLFYEPLEAYANDTLDLDNLNEEQLMDLSSHLCEFAKMPV